MILPDLSCSRPLCKVRHDHGCRARHDRSQSPSPILAREGRECAPTAQQQFMPLRRQQAPALGPGNHLRLQTKPPPPTPPRRSRRYVSGFRGSRRVNNPSSLPAAWRRLRPRGQVDPRRREPRPSPVRGRAPRGGVPRGGRHDPGCQGPE